MAASRAIRRRLCRALAAAGLVACAAVGAAACMVPVFRYALEHWPAEPYRAVVFHAGGISAQAQAAIDQLRALPVSALGTTPIVVTPVDTAGGVPEEFAGLWERERRDALPFVALCYPLPFPIDTAVWTGTPAEAAMLLGTLSPLQTELARELVSGRTAAWIFMDSGDAERDGRARAALDRALAAAERDLKLPHQLDPYDAEYDVAVAPGVELKISFAVLRLRPGDPAEPIVARILDGLIGGQGSPPYAVPVYGRGRALTALPFDTITDEALTDICTFLVGPCSCQAKEQNPGVDLLLPIDWEGMIEGTVDRGVVLPPLQVPVPASAAGDDERDLRGAAASTGTVPADPGDARPARGLWVSLAILAGVALAVVAVATAYVVVGRRRRGA